MTHVKMKLILMCSIPIVLHSTLAGDFPGPAPGPASGSAQATGVTLQNAAIAVTWKAKDGCLSPAMIENKLTGKTYDQTGATLFDVGFGKAGGSSATAWQMVGSASMFTIKPIPNTACRGVGFGGRGVRAEFRHKQTGAILGWRAELRDGANYIRTIITLKGNNPKLVVTRIEPLNVKGTGARSHGKTRGSVVTLDNLFFGVELPFVQHEIREGEFKTAFTCKLPLISNDVHEFGAVIGVWPEGQLRRGFLHYLERERARAYKPFLHYNCWFDLCRNLNEKDMLDRINEFHQHLTKERGIKLDSYVVDDGYDDSTRGFWAYHPKKFPNGFTPLAKRLAEVDSHLGIWLSPSGGYGRDSGIRRNKAKELGLIPNGRLDLSNEPYYEWFVKRHTKFIKDEQVNYFKWDRLGGGVSLHFMALLRCAHILRKLNPGLFLNTTVGTTQSPFWLNHVDCTWRGGGDMGYMGKGNGREQWLTYRDAISYKAMATSDFIYPLNALMNHGVIFSSGHSFPRKAMKGSTDLRNECRSYFGAGYALQELYINPHLMGKEQWDAVAEAVKWSRRNVDVLVDSRFIGGNPGKLEVYGFAAWQHNRGTLTLRNPNDKPQTFTFDVAKLFELPHGAKTRYTFTTPFGDQRIKSVAASVGKTVGIELKPFEVLVFDAAGK